MEDENVRKKGIKQVEQVFLIPQQQVNRKLNINCKTPLGVGKVTFFLLHPLKPLLVFVTK